MTTATPSPAAPVGRRERKKAETRQRILRAAARLFTDRGFESTTVDEIAERADVSRGTLFNYFAEKSALMAELGDGMADIFIANIDAVRQNDAPTVERLSALFVASASRLEERRDLSRAVLLETVARRSSLDERRSHTVRLHDGIARLLEDGVARGDVRTDVPLSLLAEMLAGAYVEVLLTWLVDEGYPLGQRLEQLAVVFGSALVDGASGAAAASTPSARPRRASARKRAPKR